MCFTVCVCPPSYSKRKLCTLNSQQNDIDVVVRFDRCNFCEKKTTTLGKGFLYLYLYLYLAFYVQNTWKQKMNEKRKHTHFQQKRTNTLKNIYSFDLVLFGRFGSPLICIVKHKANVFA